MQKRTSSNNKTVLVYIGGIGFMFEVNQSLKHNLISPDVLAFFEGVTESEEVTKDCAFPLGKPNTNLLHSIFKYIGEDWVICSQILPASAKLGNKFEELRDRGREIKFLSHGSFI